MPGSSGHHGHHEGGHAERGRIIGQLAEQGLFRGALDSGLGDHQAGGGRNDQRRNLCHQAVADGQKREGLRRIGEAHALLRHPDDDAADDVDADDQNTGNRVAAHEFGSAVHGAEEVRFGFQCLAPFARLGFVDQAGRQIGIHRHLLAGHRVQGETRRDFRDAARALGDDDEVHDDEDREHDDADDEIALGNEASEGLDDVAGGLRCLHCRGSG